MPALLLRLLLQCASDIEMNLGPVSTPTPTNCLRLMQSNANGISGKIAELLTFLQSNNVNIAAIHETKLTNKTKLMKTPWWAAVRLDRHESKGGGQLMLVKDTIPFVDNTTALPQSADLHLEQQCAIANNCTFTTSTFRHVAVSALVTTPRSSTSSVKTKCRLLLGILMCIIPDGIPTHTKDERCEQIAGEIDIADCTILSWNEATRLPTNGLSTSPEISLACSDITLLSVWSVYTTLANDQLPILITINSELSTIYGPRRTYINFKKADWTCHTVACD